MNKIIKPKIKVQRPANTSGGGSQGVHWAMPSGHGRGGEEGEEVEEGAEEGPGLVAGNRDFKKFDCLGGSAQQ